VAATAGHNSRNLNPPVKVESPIRCSIPKAMPRLFREEIREEMLATTAGKCHSQTLTYLQDRVRRGLRGCTEEPRPGSEDENADLA
jgi:hypothetical protein